MKLLIHGRNLEITQAISDYTRDKLSRAVAKFEGERQPGLTGVWCGGGKVAAVGIGCRRWITRHGLALNVNCDLQGFDAIVPCGLKDHVVGRLLDWRPGITCADVEPLLLAAVERQLNLELLPCPVVG
ncbi:lipoyl(octanoyl) transferase [Candidatus Synechococcus spongiarum LMB bulk10E]|nr:lipoyl(octanoyl) transferase [Candidatus Synechococcus spongiarum LMB bulk10E]